MSVVLGVLVTVICASAVFLIVVGFFPKSRAAQEVAKAEIEVDKEVTNVETKLKNL